jgi:hypothetical protein
MWWIDQILCWPRSVALGVRDTKSHRSLKSPAAQDLTRCSTGVLSEARGVLVMTGRQSAGCRDAGAENSAEFHAVTGSTPGRNVPANLRLGSCDGVDVVPQIAVASAVTAGAGL